MRDRGGTASWIGWQDFLPDAESADRRRDNHGSASGTTHQTHAITKHLKDFPSDGELLHPSIVGGITMEALAVLIITHTMLLSNTSEICFQMVNQESTPDRRRYTLTNAMEALVVQLIRYTL